MRRIGRSLASLLCAWAVFSAALAAHANQERPLLLLNAQADAPELRDGAPFAKVGPWILAVARNVLTGFELHAIHEDGGPLVLLRDIEPGLGDSTLSFAGYPHVSVGGVVLFIAQNQELGRELWRTDGTPAGTFLLKEFTPGPADGLGSSIFLINGSYDHFFGHHQGEVFFTAREGAGLGALWKTDGTLAGTQLLASSVGESDAFAEMGGLLYLTTLNRLWKTDGTSAGTAEITTLTSPDDLAATADTLFFTAAGATGRELWKSDGTALGTVLVEDICPGSCGAFPINPTRPIFRVQRISGVPTGTVFFVASDGANSFELWKSDGSAAGTEMLKDINPSGFGLRNLLGAANGDDGTLYFRASDPSSSGFEVWKSDGTPSGTQLVSDIRSGTASSLPGDLHLLGSQLLFAADDGVSGMELWRSDGSAAGTQLVADIQPGAGGSAPGSPVVLGPLLVFTADDGTDGRELWSSDGSGAGTALVADLQPGAGSGDPEDLAPLGGALYFGAAVGGPDQLLHASDGTPSGTVELGGFEALANLTPTSGSPSSFTDFSGRLYFTARLTSPREAHATDGTPAGTVLLEPASGTNTSGFAEYQGLLYFGRESELWRTDGTVAGTVLVKQISTSTTTLGWFAVANNLLFFRAEDPASGAELYRSDGTAAGTVLVKDIRPGASSSSPEYLVPGGSLLYFSADDGVSGRELWQSDGSTLGTVRVSDIRVGSQGSSPEELVTNADSLFFRADNGSSGPELWALQFGSFTPSLLQIRPGAAGADPSGMTLVGGDLYLSADDGAVGAELWRVFPSWVVELVADIQPGATGSAPADLVEHAGRLYLSADDGVSGRELWAGPPGAVSLVADIRPGGASSAPTELASAGGQLFFQACGGDEGCELWTSDGTGAGTVLRADVVPGFVSSFPGRFTKLGDGIVFASSDPLRGTELWALSLACGDGSLGTGEECDDGNCIDGDGCSETCQLEQELRLVGTAQGGSVRITVDGQVVEVETSAGESAEEILARLVAAIGADPELGILGVTASVVDGRLVTNGSIEAIVIDDPGLSQALPIPGLAALARLLLAFGLLAAARSRTRAGADLSLRA